MSFATPEARAPGDGFGRIWRRTGTRVLTYQVVALLLAFSLAGVLAHTTLVRFTEEAFRAEVLGELGSLDEEWRAKGVDHLPHTIAKRSRLWHGFDYGLAAPEGRPLAGEAALARLSRAGWSRPRTAKGPALAFTERLPGGGWMTVARDLSVEQRQMRTLDWLLALSGAAGAAICLAIAWLTTRWAWRRMDALAATAALVAEGRLDVRAPVLRAQAPDEVDEASLAFNAMLDRIGRLIEQLRRVTTDVAHDMRRPLTRLRQKLDRLGRAAAASPAVADEVRRLDADFAEILRTFDALLQLADIEGGARSESVVDLSEVAGRVAEALRPDIEESGRTLTVDITPARARGDADLLAQAVANLLENALRHTPPGARIEVSVRNGRQGAEIAVRDDGPGVPSDLREVALAPFGRLEASRSTPGSGLGLAIVASVALRHGARLELADAGPGLAAAIRFPPCRD